MVVPRPGAPLDQDMLDCEPGMIQAAHRSAKEQRKHPIGNFLRCRFLVSGIILDAFMNSSLQLFQRLESQGGARRMPFEKESAGLLTGLGD